MLKSLRRKKTRDNSQHLSVASSQSGRGSIAASQSSRNTFGDVIVISTADNYAPPAVPSAAGLSPSAPSISSFTRATKEPGSSANSVRSYGDAPPSLGVLPDDANFRSSLILPHLERRFSLLNTISPEDMRSHLRAQRARAQEKSRPFLKEEEEEEIIAQLQARIEANAKARGEVIPSPPPGKGKLGILLPPVNDHPWDSVIGRGTDGFGGHTPIYSSSADGGDDRDLDTVEEQSPDLPTANGDTSSPPVGQLSPPMGAESTGIDSPPSPSRRENNDRAVGSLFASRGTRADAAYMRNVAKQRGTDKPVSPPGESSSGPPPSPPTSATDTNQLHVTSGTGEPPQAEIGRGPDTSTLQNLSVSPSHPQINIVPDDAPEEIDNIGNIPRGSSDGEMPSFREQLQRHQQHQRQSTLLTTLTPEAFRRVSTALDELFDHFRAEAGVSPVDDESDTQHESGAAGEFDSNDMAEVPEESESQRNSVSASQDMGTTAPLSIRGPSGSNFFDQEHRPDETTTAGMTSSLVEQSGGDDGAEGHGPTMPGGLGAVPSSALSSRSGNNAGIKGVPSNLALSPFPTQSRSPSISSAITTPSGAGSPSQSPLERHARTFSIDSFGSSASSIPRNGLLPTLPSKRTSSLPKRERKAIKERESKQSNKSEADASNQTGAMSEKQKGKQRDDTGADEGSGPQRSGGEAASLRTSLTEQPLSTLAAGLNGLASAIGNGALAVATSTAAALTSGSPTAEAADQHNSETQSQSWKSQARIDDTIDEEVAQMDARSPTPRAVAAGAPNVHRRYESSSSAGAPPTPVPGPLPPVPRGSLGSSFRARPRLEHMRGASTFSQMSFTSADSFRSAEEGESIAEARTLLEEEENNSQDAGSLRSNAFDLQADLLTVGEPGIQPSRASSTSLQPPASKGRSLSATDSASGTSGRGSYMEDDELEADEEADDAFQYDRRATLRAAPRSTESFDAFDETAVRGFGLASDMTIKMPGSFSPNGTSTSTVTLQPSPVLTADSALAVTPTFGGKRELELPSSSAWASASQPGSPLPVIPAALSTDSDRFSAPSISSAATTTDRTSQFSGQGGRPPRSSGTMGSTSSATHRRDASNASVTSFSGEASLIGAHNIGIRRRSSTLSTRIYRPPSASTTSPDTPASVRSSVASGTGNVQGAPAVPRHSRNRSGSVEGLRSIDSAEHAMQPSNVAVVSQRPPAEGSSGEPMNLAGYANQYGQHPSSGRPTGRPGHMPTGSGSSYGHQRFGSAAGTQLSFDPANERIRVGPNVPNAYTFAPVSPTSGHPPSMMAHSASGTLSQPVIDSPQSPAVLPSMLARQAYPSSQTSSAHSHGGPPPPAPFEGPVAMMQMSAQPGFAISTQQNSGGQGSLANMHRRRISNKESNGSLNRNPPMATLTESNNGTRPASTTSSNGVSGPKGSIPSGGAGGLGSGFSPSTSVSHASTGQRSPLHYVNNSITSPTLSREPSDASHASRWNKPMPMTPAGPPSAYQAQMGAMGITKRPSEASLSSSLAAYATNVPITPPAMSHHSSNPSIAGSIRGTPASTTVLAGAIAARHNYVPQYHRTRGRSNSGSSAALNSIASPSGLDLAGFFTPSPPTTPASPGIQQQMSLQAQQNVAASGGFRAVASAAQAATADSMSMPPPALVAQRRAPPGPVNPPGFSFPARTSESQDGESADSRSLNTSGTRQNTASSREDTLRSDRLYVSSTTKEADRTSIRSVSDINASSDEEEEVTAPKAGRMSVGEDVWATVARNTSMQRTQGSGKGNAPGGRAASVKSPEPQMMRKRSRDLLSAPMGEASIPLHTDSSVLTAEQLAEIQSALARSETQRSVSRAGASSRLEAYPPPVPAIPDSVQQETGNPNIGLLQDTSSHSPAASTPFFSPREGLSHDSMLQGSGFNEYGSRQELGPGFVDGPQRSQPLQPAYLPAFTANTATFTPMVQTTPPTTHIAASTPVLASAFKSEVMYDVTTSHRPTSPTFSHRSKRSDLPSIRDLSTQAAGFRPISPIHDLDEHALSLSQAIDEANAQHIEFAFPAMTDQGHRRGNSSMDSRFSGRTPLPVPGTQQAAVGRHTVIQEESTEYENGHHRVSSQSRAPRRSKSHDQLTNANNTPEEDDPRTAASEAHLALGPRLVDDVAAQTRAATRALKGPEENAALAVPKRSRTLSKRKSQKKINKIISQPQLLGTTQRLDHAMDIKMPEAALKRSPSKTGNDSRSTRGKKNHDTVQSSSNDDPDNRTRHRRHSSSFGHSGEYNKSPWTQAPATPEASVGGAGSSMFFPEPSPAATSSSSKFGSRILEKFRSRKRTGDFSIFDRLTSSNAPAKSTNGLTKSPASSFGHATLGPEPPMMNDPSSFNGYANSHDSYSGYQQGSLDGSPNGLTPNYGNQPQALPRNMSQADRETRLRLVSALSFGSPLNQTIDESMGAHLVTMPEETETTQQKAAGVQVEEAKLNGSPPGRTNDTVQTAMPHLRLAPSPDGMNVAPTRSARDTIVRRTIIIPTDTVFDKRKSLMSASAKRKSRAVKPAEEKASMERNPPPSPDLSVPAATEDSKAPRSSVSAEDPKAKRTSARKSVQDRPATPPGAAGVGGLHRRKISADMLANQPLPNFSSQLGLDVPSTPRKSLNQNRGLGPSASLVSLLQAGGTDRLAPPMPSPGAPSIMSHGNGSFYDFYLNEDEDEDEDEVDPRGLQPSPSLENSMRNHIEVTERADGSVVWQVIAGLAERSSVYSDEHRLSYLSGGSRTRESMRESMMFRGPRVESVYVPETNEKSFAGLNPDDSRSFFTPKRAGHRKSFSFDNHPMPSMPSMPSAISSSNMNGEATEQLASEGHGRPSGQSFEDTSQQFTTPIGFDMATTTGPATRILYTNDADLAQLLESFALGKDSAKFDFVKEDLGNSAPAPDSSADHSRQRVEAEIYTLLNNQN
ncbi:unnamed protein product [Tilletia controversa]|nr:unnamed protein product [Tilletia controversa]